MGIEKQSSKGGNYVGGFLQMFDWNAKSRKKLFSSKSDIPEQSKQKKRCDGNLPTTRIQMMDEDEIDARSSMKGSSDYSCASSVTDEDCYRTKAPGVVARLMGLDSLPKSNISEPYSTPLFDSQSLRNSYYPTKNVEFHQDQTMQTEPKYQKVMHRPIEKFQTETLPPKSAKSIPITHHKLLSPIKSANFIPHKDAAHIMEAASRIIDSGPRGSTRPKTALTGSSSSSSVPLRVKDLREKAQAAQKPLKIYEGSQRKAVESNAVKNLKGHSLNKSWNGSTDSEESSVGVVKNNGKSISLALQAKANVLKREGLNSSKIVVKEPCEFSPNRVFKSQSSTQKSTLKKPSSQNTSNVLRQNNQKQNCIVDKGKPPLKSGSQSGKALSVDSSSSGRQRHKVNSRKITSEVKEDKREASCSSSERVTRKKRSIDGNYHSEKSQKIEEVVKCGGGGLDRQGSSSSWDQESGNDVISFTFTAPMTRLGSRGGSSSVFSGGSQSKRTMVGSDGTSFSKFSFPGHSLRGGDALSSLLEQKLKELAHTVELSQQKSGTDLTSSTMIYGNPSTDAMEIDNQEGQEEMSVTDNIISRAQKLLDCRHPSPVSVFEHYSFGDSCNSSETADSNNSTKGSKQCSSVQAQEVFDTTYSSKTFHPMEIDTELSDSASSISAGNVAKRREITTLTSTYSCKKPITWELEYVKKMLCNIETTFNDYASGRTHDIISPHLFDQLESWNGGGGVPRISRRLMFDCVNECVDLRFRHYVGGGFKLWTKGLSVIKRKERLVEEVHKEISGLSSMGDYMVDELVDKDMSSQHGRWLDFETEVFELGIQIESRILNTLIDEVVSDLLLL